MAVLVGLLIIFKDGTSKTINVEDYGIYNDNNNNLLYLFYFKKNGRTSFVTPDSVVFFGNEFDYNSSNQEGE